MNRRSFFSTLCAVLIVPFLPRDKFWKFHSYPVNVSIPICIPELGRKKPYYKYPSGDIIESTTYYGESKVWIDDHSSAHYVLH